MEHDNMTWKVGMDATTAAAAVNTAAKPPPNA
jgi:hypothetical protein